MSITQLKGDVLQWLKSFQDSLLKVHSSSTFCTNFSYKFQAEEAIMHVIAYELVYMHKKIASCNNTLNIKILSTPMMQFPVILTACGTRALNNAGVAC